MSTAQSSIFNMNSESSDSHEDRKGARSKLQHPERFQGATPPNYPPPQTSLSIDYENAPPAKLSSKSEIKSLLLVHETKRASSSIELQVSGQLTPEEKALQRETSLFYAGIELTLQHEKQEYDRMVEKYRRDMVSFAMLSRQTLFRLLFRLLIKHHKSRIFRYWHSHTIEYLRRANKLAFSMIGERVPEFAVQQLVERFLDERRKGEKILQKAVSRHIVGLRRAVLRSKIARAVSRWKTKCQHSHKQEMAMVLVRIHRERLHAKSRYLSVVCLSVRGMVFRHMVPSRWAKWIRIVESVKKTNLNLKILSKVTVAFMYSAISLRFARWRLLLFRQVRHNIELKLDYQKSHAAKLAMNLESEKQKSLASFDERYALQMQINDFLVQFELLREKQIRIFRARALNDIRKKIWLIWERYYRQRSHFRVIIRRICSRTTRIAKYTSFLWWRTTNATIRQAAFHRGAMSTQTAKVLSLEAKLSGSKLMLAESLVLRTKMKHIELTISSLQASIDRQRRSIRILSVRRLIIAFGHTFVDHPKRIFFWRWRFHAFAKTFHQNTMASFVVAIYSKIMRKAWWIWLRNEEHTLRQSLTSKLADKQKSVEILVEKNELNVRLLRQIVPALGLADISKIRWRKIMRKSMLKWTNFTVTVNENKDIDCCMEMTRNTYSARLLSLAVPVFHIVTISNRIFRKRLHGAMIKWIQIVMAATNFSFDPLKCRGGFTIISHADSGKSSPVAHGEVKPLQSADSTFAASH